MKIADRICWFLRLVYRPHPFCLPDTPSDLRRRLRPFEAWDMAGVICR